MRDYELMFLVSPQIADDEVDGVVERVRQFVTSRGGEITKVNPWGRRNLAYYIEDFKEASYVLTTFTLDPKDTKDLESSLTISEDIIRHLLTKVEEIKVIEKKKSRKPS